MPALCSPRHAQHSAESGTHLFNYMLTIWWMNKWMNVNFLPKKHLQGFPFQISILPHGILQPALPLASSASLCCTLPTWLIKFPLSPLPSSNPPFRAWALSHPGSFPVPIVQIFLELLLGITHFVLNHSPAPLQPRLFSSEDAEALKVGSLLLLLLCPIPTPGPGQSLSASCSFQRDIPLIMFSQKITSSQCLLWVSKPYHAPLKVLTFQFTINYSAAHFQPKSSFLQHPFSSSHHLRAAFTSNGVFTICALLDTKAMQHTQKR